VKPGWARFADRRMPPHNSRLRKYGLVGDINVDLVVGTRSTG